MLKYDLLNKTVGKGFADSFEELAININDTITFTRREMIEELGCANFNAATRLQKALKKLDIVSPARLFRTDPFSILRIKGIGVTSMYVAMCILDFNDYSVAEWWGWKGTNHTKFSSFKHRAIKKASKHKQEV